MTVSGALFSLDICIYHSIISLPVYLWEQIEPEIKIVRASGEGDDYSGFLFRIQKISPKKLH
ncbi:MAG: hypothetical protein ABJE79_00295 [Marinomonas sp.]